MAKPNPLSQGLSHARQAPAAAGPASTDEAAPAKPVKLRGGRVLIGGHFAPEVQTELKILAAQERTTVQELVAEGLDAVLARRHKPQIATLTPQAAAPSGSHG